MAEQRKDSLSAVKKLKDIEVAKQLAEQKIQDSISGVREQEKLAIDAKQAQKTKDSLAAVQSARNLEEAKLAAAQKSRDSIAAVR